MNNRKKIDEKALTVEQRTCFTRTEEQELKYGYVGR